MRGDSIGAKKRTVIIPANYKLRCRTTSTPSSQLHALLHEPAGAETILELRRFLADASSLIVAEAAKILKDQTAFALAGDLVAAFDRLVIEPEESDKQCRAKIEIVAALNRLEYREADVFLRGLNHRQEPASASRAKIRPVRCERFALSVWPGSIITASYCCWANCCSTATTRPGRGRPAL